MRAFTQAKCDDAVANCFGYHALQIGANNLPLMRNSRTTNCWVADIAYTLDTNTTNAQLSLHPAALPFPENSIDAILMPHTLEFTSEPHATLREAQRVLVPEGRLIIIGFNPKSLWGLQHASIYLAQKLGICQHPLITNLKEPIKYHRLRDWLSLLNFDIAAGCFYNYRPSLRNDKWFKRLQSLELVGDRWFASFGNIYFLQAIKRTHGVRLIQPNWKFKKQHSNSAVAIQKQHHSKK